MGNTADHCWFRCHLSFSYVLTLECVVPKPKMAYLVSYRCHVSINGNGSFRADWVGHFYHVNNCLALNSHRLSYHSCSHAPLTSLTNLGFPVFGIIRMTWFDLALAYVASFWRESLIRSLSTSRILSFNIVEVLLKLSSWKKNRYMGLDVWSVVFFCVKNTSF